MMHQNFTYKNSIATVIIAAIAWFAVIMQFLISVPEYMQKGETLAGSIVHLASYFTILTNILVAVSLTSVLLFPETFIGRFFSKISSATAIAVYITIVALVYNLVLRPFWSAKGAFKTNDELLHVVVPALYLLNWLFFLPKKGLVWKQLPNWLIFPLCYLFYVIIRGALTGFYPYFFVDVKRFGYAAVALNAFVLLIVFAVFCAMFISIGRKMISKKPVS
ncbi:Pr6Pr family membrane protein [uncultured Mucilaginibacter sp.]|uniref:Pr6Pr family membrane protein n=1 Tax=uncultured Mucilaginibacter sp. TaxID=797541 RepID=UPI00262D921D|nr:Pr6Pr family membrane protein [uncultured Mucilaginibacter sp.]